MSEAAQQDLFEQPEAAGKGYIPAGPVRVALDREWMPDAVAGRVRAACGSLGRAVSFSAAEKKILRKRKKVRVSEWAARHRVLTMSRIPGRWNNAVTPYLVGIMDAAQYPSVRVVSVQKCPQSGVTEAVHNFVGCAIDQDPGPVLYVFPDQDMAEENSRDRILPMIKSSKRLSRYLTKNRHDEAMIRINLAHMPIYLGWATSPSRLGNKPIRYGIADECAKYRAPRSKETGALQLIDKRFTTYRDISKFFKISTPIHEKDEICKAMDEAEVVFYQWVRCPLCGRDQRMVFERIKFFDCRDPKEMRRRSLARYECCRCGGHWDDYQRDKALAAAHWRAQKSEDEPMGLELYAYLSARRPQNIAFHLPAWETTFVSMSESAAVFLESLTGDLDKRKEFQNQHAALPYVSVVTSPVETEFKAALVPDLAAQVVPDLAVALTCGIDCQKYGFYFLVRAWARDYTSWMIHYGKLATWEDVEQLLFSTTYPTADGSRHMAIARAAIDTGGSKFNEQSMYEEAVFWIRKNGAGRGTRVWGIQGASWPQPNKIKVSKPFDKTPSGKAIPGGLQILTLDTEQFKDALFFRLQQAVEGRELAAYLNAGTDENYFAHITAEEKRENEKGVLRWEKKTSGRRNDWLDCEVYAAAAADPEWPEGGVHLMVPPAAAADKRAGSGGRQGQTRPGRDAGAGGTDIDRGGGGPSLPGWINDY